MRQITVSLAVWAFAFLFVSESAAQVINACTNPNGNLRVVADLTACVGNETPLSWNVQGPKGEPGNLGADGQPGPEGPPGSSLPAAGTDMWTALMAEQELFRPHEDNCDVATEAFVEVIPNIGYCIEIDERPAEEWERARNTWGMSQRV